jgi:hypothetical protein
MEKPRELTESEMETVEQNLADLFVHEWNALADELGLSFPLSDEDQERLNAEFDSRHRQHFIDLVLANDAPGI